METIYIKNDTDDSFRGGFSIESVNNSTFNSEHDIQITEGGGKKHRLHNKAIPFGLAMKRVKPYVGYECKNGDVLNNDMFEKLLTSVAKIERNNNNKISKSNKTKKSHKQFTIHSNHHA